MQCGKMFKKSKTVLIFILMRKKLYNYMDDISIWMLYKYGVCIDMNEFFIYRTVSMAIYTSHENLWHCPYFSQYYDQLTIYTGIYLQNFFTSCGIKIEDLSTVRIMWKHFCSIHCFHFQFELFFGLYLKLSNISK